MVLEGKNSILLRMLIAVVLIFCFVMMENPNLISKLADINIQAFYLGKSIVFILSYFALFVALVLLSLSVSFCINQKITYLMRLACIALRL